MAHKIIEEFVQKITTDVPEGLKQTQKEIESNAKLLLEGAVDKLNLVSRDEFEIQQKVLIKTREKLEQLEAKVALLEQALSDKTPNSFDKK